VQRSAGHSLALGTGGTTLTPLARWKRPLTTLLLLQATVVLCNFRGAFFVERARTPGSRYSAPRRTLGRCFYRVSYSKY